MIYGDIQRELIDDKYKDLSETTLSKKLVNDYKPIMKKYKPLTALLPIQINSKSVKEMARKLIEIARSDDRFLLDMSSKVREFSDTFKLDGVSTSLIRKAIVEVFKMDTKYFGVKSLDESFDEQTRKICRNMFVDGILEYNEFVEDPEIQQLFQVIYEEELKKFEAKKETKVSETLLKKHMSIITDVCPDVTKLDIIGQINKPYQSGDYLADSNLYKHILALELVEAMGASIDGKQITSVEFITQKGSPEEYNHARTYVTGIRFKYGDEAFELNNGSSLGENVREVPRIKEIEEVIERFKAVSRNFMISKISEPSESQPS